MEIKRKNKFNKLLEEREKNPKSVYETVYDSTETYLSEGKDIKTKNKVNELLKKIKKNPK